MKQDANRKADIEKLLSQGNTVQLHPQGYSMYPLFMPERDEAIIAPVTDVSQLKRGDVVLYRREGGILVLHRICKVNGSGFYLVGDNQTEVEGPLRAEQMRGVLVAFIRKGKEIPADDPIYRLASRLWLFLRPVRRCITVPIAWLKRTFFRRKNENNIRK